MEFSDDYIRTLLTELGVVKISFRSSRNFFVSSVVAQGSHDDLPRFTLGSHIKANILLFEDDANRPNFQNQNRRTLTYFTISLKYICFLE